MLCNFVGCCPESVFHGGPLTISWKRANPTPPKEVKRVEEEEEEEKLNEENVMEQEEEQEKEEVTSTVSSRNLLFIPHLFIGNLF